MISAETKPSSCPKCGHGLDMATSTEIKGRQVPVKGDISICIYCFSINRFENDHALRVSTPEEISESILEAPEMYTKVENMRRYREETGKNPILRAPGDGQ